MCINFDNVDMSPLCSAIVGCREKFRLVYCAVVFSQLHVQCLYRWSSTPRDDEWESAHCQLLSCLVERAFNAC